MKRIILTRHATAVKRGGAGKDFDRVLRKRGRREARDVARWYADYLPPPQLWLSSPAGRALETAGVFAEVLGHRGRIATNRLLYDGGVAEMLEVIRHLADKADSVIVFGHDPAFTEFAAAMAPAFDQPLPKCGLVVIDTRRRRWSTLRPGDGVVSAFQHPQALAAEQAAARALLERLSERIAAAIAAELDGAGVDLEDDDRERVSRSGRKLARRFAARVTVDGEGPER